MDCINIIEEIVPKMKQQMHHNKDIFSIDEIFMAISKYDKNHTAIIPKPYFESFLSQIGVYLKTQELSELYKYLDDNGYEISIMKFIDLFKVHANSYPQLEKKVKEVFSLLKNENNVIPIETIYNKLSLRNHPLVKVYKQTEEYAKAKFDNEIKLEDVNIINKESEIKDENSNNINVGVDAHIDPYDETKDQISSEEIEAKSDEIEETTNNEKKYKIDFEYLKKQNPDIIGWIKVEGTKIEYPVVKTSDNNYYLTHNLYKNKSKSGWIFADYRNKLDSNDKNIIIYGHNMRNDSMFGTLEKIFSSTWYEKEENRRIIFITENEYSIYETFSIYQTQNQNDSYYVTTDFYDLEYEEFISNIKNRSIINFEKEMNTNPILTLSTCTDDSKHRIVLHAQKVENN